MESVLIQQIEAKAIINQENLSPERSVSYTVFRE